MIPIPPEALEDAGIVLGRRGSGKSNVLMILFEQELDAGHRAVMVDPKGDRWGIRLNPDGAPSRFTIPIFGGDHSDIPINETSGEEIGRLVAEHDLSCLIDLSRMSLQSKQTFMMGFAPALLHHNRAALTLFLEEVDQFANQDPRYQPPMLVHHIANFATLGRQRGIVPWVASQRPAKVNATVRSQADTFIAMKVTSPLDRDAYRDWFKGHGKDAAARVEEEVGRLQPGEALVWVGATEFFGKVQFPLASTYDSGRTPKHGERIADVEMPSIELGAIRAALRSVETNLIPATSNEDANLILARNARIADLETERDALRQICAKKDERIEQLTAERDCWQTIADRRIKMIQDARIALIDNSVSEIPAQGGGGPEVDEGQTEGRQLQAASATTSPNPRAKPQRQRQEPPEVTERECSPCLNASARKMLDMLKRIAPARVPWGALAAMIGNKARGGNFNAARKAMREDGQIVEDGDTVRFAGTPMVGMDRNDAINLWKSVLANPAPRMIDALLVGGPMSKVVLGSCLNIVPRGGNFNNGIAQLVRNGLVVDHGGKLSLAEPLPGESA